MNYCFLHSTSNSKLHCAKKAEGAIFIHLWKETSTYPFHVYFCLDPIYTSTRYAKCPIKYTLLATHAKWVYKDVGVLREATREWSPSLDLSAATTRISLPTLPVGRVQPNPLRAGLSLLVRRSLWHTVDFNPNSIQRKSKKSENRKYKGKREMRGHKKIIFLSLSLLLLRGYLPLTSPKTCWFISFPFVCVCVRARFWMCGVCQGLNSQVYVPLLNGT